MIATAPSSPSAPADAPVLDRPLVANGAPLSTAPNRLGRLRPTSADLPIAELHQRYVADGYLWLKNFFPRDEILAFRRWFFASFADLGLLAAGTDPVEGIYANQEDRAVTRARHTEVARSATYEAFCRHPKMVKFYEEFLGGAVYLHKRMIIRYTRPGDASSTGAHYDLTYLRAGTDQLCSSWIPFGDVPTYMGGLVYLEGSDAWGRKMEAEFVAKAADLPAEERISAYNRHMTKGGWLSKNLSELADRLDTPWLMADYEAGDMVVHSPYMIHAATANEDTAGRMRLSTDIRYQRANDAIDDRWRNYWAPDDGL